jgi:hypothetical protein
LLANRFIDKQLVGNTACIQLFDIKFVVRRSLFVVLLLRTTNNDLHQFSGDCIDRVTPVPIPNTVVKPVGADDTAAFSCGKVGSRRINMKEARSEMSGLFCVIFAGSLNTAYTHKKPLIAIASLSGTTKSFFAGFRQILKGIASWKDQHTSASFQ